MPKSVITRTTLESRRTTSFLCGKSLTYQNPKEGRDDIYIKLHIKKCLICYIYI